MLRNIDKEEKDKCIQAMQYLQVWELYDAQDPTNQASIQVNVI